MKKVYLFRHGDVTKEDGIPRYFGATDVALNKKGYNQAEKITDFFKDKNIECVYSSKLSRTKEIASLISSKYKIDHKIIPSFNEINFGKWEGLSFDEIKNSFPKDFDLWIQKKVDFIFPEGESLLDVTHRVLPAYRDIIFNTVEKVIVMILHSSVIKIILCDALQSENSFWHFNQNYAAMNIVEYFEDNYIVSLVNDTNYLK